MTCCIADDRLVLKASTLLNHIQTIVIPSPSLLCQSPTFVCQLSGTVWVAWASVVEVVVALALEASRVYRSWNWERPARQQEFL